MAVLQEVAGGLGVGAGDIGGCTVIPAVICSADDSLNKRKERKEKKRKKERKKHEENAQIQTRKRLKRRLIYEDTDTQSENFRDSNSLR